MSRLRASHTRSTRKWIIVTLTLVLPALGAAPLGAQEAAKPAAPTEPGIDQKKAALKAAIETRVEANERGAKFQEQIDEIADESDALNAQYRTALKQIEAIRKFNDQMRSLIDSQRSELASVADQLDRVEEVGRNVTPLMLRMIDALEAFIQLDIPFLEEERRTNIANLRKLMDRADVTSATKFRQIMESYQTENEYGRTIEAYRSRVDVDGRETIADLLRFGRIGLVFQSLDGLNTGVWNQEARAWQLLDPEHAAAIRKGIRIARKLEPPDLIEIPLPPPSAPTVPAVAQSEAPETVAATPNVGAAQ